MAKRVEMKLASSKVKEKNLQTLPSRPSTRLVVLDGPTENDKTDEHEKQTSSSDDDDDESAKTDETSAEHECTRSL